MHMKATITGKQLAGIVAVPARVWFNAGNGLRLRIIDRTRRQNVDADGAPFEAYSEGYKKAKGKKSGLSGGGRVDLTGAGGGPKMLNNIVLTARATNNPRIQLYFATAEKAQIAQYHMGEGRVDRKFFAMSDDDTDYIVNYVKNWAKTGAGSQRG